MTMRRSAALRSNQGRWRPSRLPLFEPRVPGVTSLQESDQAAAPRATATTLASCGNVWWTVGTSQRILNHAYGMVDRHVVSSRPAVREVTAEKRPAVRVALVHDRGSITPHPSPQKASTIALRPASVIFTRNIEVCEQSQKCLSYVIILT